jgi:hypothetical protein
MRFSSMPPRMNVIADSIRRLHTKALYSWLSLGLHEDSHILLPSFVWNNIAPPRVKLYLWLASRDKLQTQANLPRKGIISDDTYEICSSGPKTTSHILLHCSPARNLWHVVGIQISEDLNCFNLHRLPQPCGLLPANFPTFVVLCC